MLDFLDVLQVNEELFRHFFVPRDPVTGMDILAVMKFVDCDGNIERNMRDYLAESTTEMAKNFVTLFASNLIPRQIVVKSKATNGISVSTCFITLEISNGLNDFDVFRATFLEKTNTTFNIA